MLLKFGTVFALVYCMKYRIKHDCDGYRIQESLLGLVWFDSSVDRFYQPSGYCVAKYSITNSRFYDTKEDVMEVARRVKAILPSFEIRDYQIDLVLASVTKYASLIVSATASGKTSTMTLLSLIWKRKKIVIY